jgi:hypothetical protein
MAALAIMEKQALKARDSSLELEAGVGNKALVRFRFLIDFVSFSYFLIFKVVSEFLIHFFRVFIFLEKSPRFATFFSVFSF